ncbi:hypothetical protein [Nonomuraea dietziae]|uniref:hypothetical protein n=1 Tax=Nonomuraea dietziae TaxID=65515 RepID=UPI0031D1DD7D
MRTARPAGSGTSCGDAARPADRHVLRDGYASCGTGARQRTARPAGPGTLCGTVRERFSARRFSFSAQGFERTGVQRTGVQRTGVRREDGLPLDSESTRTADADDATTVDAIAQHACLRAHASAPLPFTLAEWLVKEMASL